MGEKACFWSVLTWLDYPFRVGHLIRPAHTQFLTIYPVLTEIQVFGCFAIDILFFLRWFRWHGLMLRAVHYSLAWGRHPSKLSPWTTTINRTHVLFGKAPPTNTVGVSLSAIYPIRDDAAFSQCISGQWLAEKLSNDHSTSPLRDADPNIFDWHALEETNGHEWPLASCDFRRNLRVTLLMDPSTIDFIRTSKAEGRGRLWEKSYGHFQTLEGGGTYQLNKQRVSGEWLIGEILLVHRGTFILKTQL